MRNRAVSDVLGFVLVFSLITASVGVVYATGFSGLQDARDAEQIDNTMRAFDVLTDNMADIQRQSAPARGTEIKLANAELKHGEEQWIRVNVTNVPDNSSKVDFTPIVYSAETTDIVYATGAVIRSQPGGAVMAIEPNFVFTTQGGERTAVMPMIETETSATGVTAISGSETVLVRAAGGSPGEEFPAIPPAASDYPPESEYQIRLTVKSSERSAEAWMRYFNEEISWVADPCDDGGDDDPSTIECSFSVDRLHVTSVHTSVTFE